MANGVKFNNFSKQRLKTSEDRSANINARKKEKNLGSLEEVENNLISFDKNNFSSLYGFIDRGEKVANDIVAPVLIGGSLAAGLANAISVFMPGKKPILDQTFFNKLNFAGDLISAASILTMPLAAVGNFMRAFLNLGMSDENTKAFLNKLFQFAGFFIKVSWAANENPQAREARAKRNTIAGKSLEEIKHGLDIFRQITDPKSYISLAKDLKNKGVRAIGHRTSGILRISAWGGLAATTVLMLDELLKKIQRDKEKLSLEIPEALPNQNSAAADSEVFNFNNQLPQQVTVSKKIEEMGRLEKIGWGGIIVSSLLTTLSYLSKVFDKSYYERNNLVTVILSGISFFVNIASALLSHNPVLGQWARLGGDFVSRVQSLIERRTIKDKFS